MTARALTAVVMSTVFAVGLGLASMSRAAAECAGLAATIEGSVGADFLIGTPSDDVIVGAAGNDEILALEGADTVCAGPGDDAVGGADGADRLFGEDGDDRLVGEAGNDAIDGGDGFDSVDYRSAPGGVGVSLVGGTGTGSGGQDDLRSLELVVGSPYDDTLIGGDDNETLIGAGGDDRLYGRNGIDVLSGLEGEDLLMGGAGLGDVAGFWMDPAPVVADLEAETATVAGEQDELLEIEGLWGSPYDDVLRGDDAENQITGNSGDDVLDGRGARDTVVYPPLRVEPGPRLVDAGPVRVDLRAGTGSDRSDQSEIAGDTLSSFESVLGTDRDDRLIGTDGSNSLTGFGGDDILDGRGADDALDGGTGSDALLGGPGLDVAAWLLDPEPLKLDLNVGRAESGRDRDSVAGIENAVGTPFDDVMRGDGRANALVGMAGKDALYGRGGGDGLHGRGIAAVAEFGVVWLGMGPAKDRVLDGGSGRDACEGKPPRRCERNRLTAVHAEFLDRIIEAIQDIKRRHGVRLHG